MCMQIATGDDYTHFEGSVHGSVWWELWWNIDHVTRLRRPIGLSNFLKVTLKNSTKKIEEIEEKQRR